MQQPSDGHEDAVVPIVLDRSSAFPTGVTFQPASIPTQVFASRPRLAIRRPLNVMNIPAGVAWYQSVPAPLWPSLKRFSSGWRTSKRNEPTHERSHIP
jgi:hypothetical protein